MLPFRPRRVGIGSNAEPSPHTLFPAPMIPAPFTIRICTFVLTAWQPRLGGEDSSFTEREGVLFLHVCCQDVSGPHVVAAALAQLSRARTTFALL